MNRGTRRRVIRAHDGRCQHCRVQLWFDLTIHHVVPRSEGGSDHDSNLLPLCRPCHNVVHGMPREPSPRRHDRARFARRQVQARMPALPAPVAAPAAAVAGAGQCPAGGHRWGVFRTPTLLSLWCAHCGTTVRITAPAREETGAERPALPF